MNFDKGEAGAGGKTSELPARKSLMNCPCREAKAELRMQNEIWRNWTLD
jgi:hypothetical protein